MDLVEAAWDEHRPPDPELIKDCVHCGFCLPTCPSYLTFEEEMDSPRGRIVLMRVGHEDAELSDEMVTHFDRCLGCMACVTACPSGVQYDKLIEQTRPQIERHADRPLAQRAWRRGIFELFTHPGRLRALVPVLALQQKSGLNDALGKLPIPKLQSLLGLAPDVPASAAFRQLPKLTPARGESRGRIALMQGCINRVFFGDVNAATVRVLAAEGFEVHAPRQPRCCGSLMMHAGLEDEALALARETIAAYEDFDAIARQRRRLRLGHEGLRAPARRRPRVGRARRGVQRQGQGRVSELLADCEPRVVRHPLKLKVAYHDACHLAHAQGVREPPRELLRSIPDLELVEPDEWQICCGSAGIYNLVQPEAAAKLGKRKADNLAATEPDAIAAGNPGCALQIAGYMDREVPIFHPMTLLDASQRNLRPEEIR